MRAVLVAAQRGETDRGLSGLSGCGVGIAVSAAAIGGDLVLDFLGIDRNEGFAIRFGQRIGLSGGRADQFGVGYGGTGFNIFELAVRGEGMVFGNDGGIVGNLAGNLIRQGGIRIVRHGVRSGFVGHGLRLQGRGINAVEIDIG